MQLLTPDICIVGAGSAGLWVAAGDARSARRRSSSKQAR